MDSISRLGRQLSKLKHIAYLATLNRTHDKGVAPELRPLSLMIWNWRFFIATSVNSRKAKEIVSDPLVSFLVPLQKDGYNGYLRAVGRASMITDPVFCDHVGTATGYTLVKYWQEGGRDKDLFFAEIIPARLEFMDPGEDDAKDITSEYFETLNTAPFGI